MFAIDTNILVRYLTADHPQQSKKARMLIDTRETYVSRTVMLESEWVLRSVYGFSRRQTANALRDFAGLPGVTVEAPAFLALALDRAEEGIDFADSLHLGAADGCEAMMTFDHKFIATARAVGFDKVKQP